MPEEPNWLETPAHIYVLLKDAADHVLALRREIFAFPLAVRELVDRVYYHPYEKYAHVVMGDYDEKTWNLVENALGSRGPVCLSDNTPPPARYEEPWVLVKAGGAPLSGLASLSNFKPNAVNRLFGGPSPLAATLSGGLLGAGLGYGTGWLAEKFLPEKHFNKGRLRKVLALLGGAAGTLPGAAWGASSMQSNPESPGMGAWVNGWPMRDQDQEKVGSIEEAGEALFTVLGEKRAFNFAGGGGLPPIQTDAFNRVVWQDQRTPLDVRAATTGLVESAAVLQGGSDLVSPADIGRIAAGMGSGWVSGMLVGKTLGALAGLKPESQEKLQQMGVWAGVLNNIIPMAFKRI